MMCLSFRTARTGWEWFVCQLSPKVYISINSSKHQVINDFQSMVINKCKLFHMTNDNTVACLIIKIITTIPNTYIFFLFFSFSLSFLRLSKIVLLFFFLSRFRFKLNFFQFEIRAIRVRIGHCIPIASCWCRDIHIFFSSFLFVRYLRCLRIFNYKTWSVWGIKVGTVRYSRIFSATKEIRQKKWVSFGYWWEKQRVCWLSFSVIQLGHSIQRNDAIPVTMLWVNNITVFSPRIVHRI